MKNTVTFTAIGQGKNEPTTFECSLDHIIPTVGVNHLSGTIDYSRWNDVPKNTTADNIKEQEMITINGRPYLVLSVDPE